MPTKGSGKPRVVLVFIASAEADVEELGRYLEEHVSLTFARAKVRRLLSCAKRLLDHPELGLAVTVGTVTARRLVCDDHLVYYTIESRPQGQVVVVLRFWGAHRDPATLRLA
jgi:plasmid stabilization system protein ParE